MFGGTALITRRYYLSHFFASSAETRLLSPQRGTRPAPVSELLHQQQTTAILQESVICITYIKAMEGLILRRYCSDFAAFFGWPGGMRVGGICICFAMHDLQESAICSKEFLLTCLTQPCPQGAGRIEPAERYTASPRFWNIGISRSRTGIRISGIGIRGGRSNHKEFESTVRDGRSSKKGIWIGNQGRHQHQNGI